MKLRILIAVAILIISCNKVKIEAPTDVEVNDFIWSGLNTYYFWQKNVSDLSDVRFLDNSDYNLFLSSENQHEKFFDNLLYQKDVIDKWSWIVDDYIALEKALQGSSFHNGMEFGLVRYKNNPANIYGYVRYVLPNTDAERENVVRGMIFNAVNDTQLTENNYRNLLFTSTNYTIHLADYNNGNPIENGNSINLVKSEYEENPVFITKTFTTPSKKIGYLMYNGFTSKFDDRLNAAILTLKNEQITDLIIDLRYNGGGSVRTTTYLASMITGQFNNEIFAKKYWNDKVQPLFSVQSLEERFTTAIDTKYVKENINSLHLNEVYFITTGSSASASELIINGLNPYITVKTIGTRTHGKYAASVTLYDSPNFVKEDVNPNHTWAMQPIVLETKNKLDINDKDGFDPTIEFSEDYNNLGVLGELSDPLLQRAINYVNTGAKGKLFSKSTQHSEISNSKLALPTGNNMYVDIK